MEVYVWCWLWEATGGWGRTTVKGGWLLIWHLMWPVRRADCTYAYARWGQSDKFSLVARARARHRSRDLQTGPRARRVGIWARRRRANPTRPRHRPRSPRPWACRGLPAGGRDRPTAETATACAVACVHRGRPSPSTNRRHRIGRRTAAAPDEGHARLRSARRRASTTELDACAVTPTSASVLQRLPHRPRCSRQRRPSGRDGHHSGGWRGRYRGGAGVYVASAAPILCPERAPGDNLLGCTWLHRQRHTKGG